MECFPSKVFPALQQSTRYLHNNMIRAHPLQYGHNLLSRTYCKSPFCNISATFFTKRARSLSKPVCRSSYLQQHDLILPTQHQCLPMIIGNVPAGATCHVTSTQPISNILFQSNIGGFLWFTCGPGNLGASRNRFLAGMGWKCPYQQHHCHLYQANKGRVLFAWCHWGLPFTVYMPKNYKAPLASHSYPFLMVSGQALHIILSNHGEACAQTAKGVNRFTPNNRAMG